MFQTSFSAEYNHVTSRDGNIFKFVLLKEKIRSVQLLFIQFDQGIYLYAMFEIIQGKNENRLVLNKHLLDQKI